MQKDLEIFNKSSENNSFSERIKELLEKLLLKENSVQSLLLILAYDVDLKPGENVSSFSNGKIHFSLKEKFQLDEFKQELVKICDEYQKRENKKLSIVIAYNFEKDIFIKNFEKNMQRKEDDDTPKLNVTPIAPKYRLDQMILRDSVKEEISKIIVLIQNIDKIYNEWGFQKIDSTPRCIVNFFGPAGTGKTMAAHAVACELGQKILPLNYSDIESKFWGDAPKNLASAFKIAEKEKCVLFFDEADSFLGKRITNVSSSSDQAVNSLRSQMLILLENFTGTVIFATTLHKNYDRAFESRILRHIEFFLPNSALRAQIISKMIPENAPVKSEVKDSAFIEKLGNIIEGFSPREIKNTILDVLTTSLYSGADLDKTLFENVFENAKATFDSLQDDEDNSQKNRVQEKIKKHFANSENHTVNDSELSGQK